MFVKTDYMDSIVTTIVTISLMEDLDVLIATYEFPSKYHGIREFEARADKMSGIIVPVSDLDDLIQGLRDMKEEIKKRQNSIAYENSQSLRVADIL